MATQAERHVDLCQSLDLQALLLRAFRLGQQHNRRVETSTHARLFDAAWARYGFAAAVFAAALVLRISLLPLEARLAFSTFYPAVAVSLYFCRVGPGIMVALLGMAAGIYYFSPPYRTWDADTGSWLAGGSYMLASLVTAWVIARLQRTSRLLTNANRNLAKSERRLRSVIVDQTEMLFRFDHDGNFLFANDVGRNTFRLTDEAMDGKTWHLLVSPDERQGVVEQLRQLTPDHDVVKTETRFPGPDGDTRWGEFVHHASFDAAGRIVEVQTVGRDVTERRQLEERLADVSASLQDLYDNAPCGYYSLDAQGRFVRANATMLRWLGCTHAEVIGLLSPLDFFTPEGVADFKANFAKFMASGQVGPLEFDLCSRDGTLRRVSVMATAIRDDAGAFVKSRSVMYDVTELAEAQRELLVLNRQQHAMLDNDLVGIIKVKDRRTVWNNRAMERMFGYADGELDGQSARVLYPDQAAFESAGRAAYPVLEAGGNYRTQLQLVRKDGSPLWVDMSGAMVSPESHESIWLMLDITAMKAHADRVEHEALHDALTGLPNRALLGDRLKQALLLIDRLRHLAAVCFVDLDGFKAINDQHGHAAGDRVLQTVAQRLQDCVRAHDAVARLGGDEFVLVLTNLTSRDEGLRVLERALRAIAQPIELDAGVSGQVSASIGVAFYPTDGQDGTRLLELADEAMYRAKISGKSVIRESGSGRLEASGPA